MASPAILWFRRDLRLGDHPALLDATARGAGLAVFVLDDALLGPSGAVRRTFLFRCLRDLDERLDGRLLVLRGDPVEVIPRLAREVSAPSVHVSADAGPYGRRRDDTVRRALEADGVAWEPKGSPYAVTPGRITKRDGSPYKVYTPFRRAWADHGWPRPADSDGESARWADVDSLGGVAVPNDEVLDVVLPDAGEAAAWRTWRAFLDTGLDDYDGERDRPDRAGTSRMSPYLRWGCVHPRSLLAELAGRRGNGVSSYRDELAFREFYADVLWNWPRSARDNFDRRFDRIRLDWDDEAFTAWCRGRTGYPIVDAGMRQLLAEGWMHNRIRMVVASFLVKDLHLPWWWGARHFMRHLVDGDLASNQHGWQWAAGSGTDAAPYFRVFNPTTQGEKFDPTGDYVRRYVPELRGVDGKNVHQPWKLSDGPPHGYPAPLVDHGEERRDALARYDEIRTS